MEEVDVLVVDDGGELGKLVESCLLAAPVVGGGPVLGEALEVVQRDAEVPANAGQLVGPARPEETLVQIVEIGLRNLNSEGAMSVIVTAVTLTAIAVSRSPR